MTAAVTNGAEGTAGNPRNGLVVYAMYVAGLFAPGVSVPLHVDPDESFEAALDRWETEDLQLMIAEGQRQYDGQLAQLDQIRSRAQWLFSTALALGAALATFAKVALLNGGVVEAGLWILAAATGTWALLGSVAIITVRADFEGIATKRLSAYAPPVAKRLARDYAEMLERGDLTVATTLTLFRQAVLWLIMSAYASLLTFLLTR
jgi:hypothetical protein